MKNENLDFIMNLDRQDILSVNSCYEKDHDINEEYFVIEIILIGGKNIYIESVLTYKNKEEELYMHIDKYSRIFREYAFKLDHKIYTHIRECVYKFQLHKNNEERKYNNDVLNKIKLRSIEGLRDFIIKK